MLSSPANQPHKTGYSFMDCGIKPHEPSSVASFKLQLHHFEYHLPAANIALHPTPQRDGSRLCQLTTSGDISDHQFHELVDILPPKSLLIFNDSEVFQARIYHPLASGSTLEILLFEPPHFNHAGIRCLGHKKQLLRHHTLMLAEELKVEFFCDHTQQLRIRFFPNHTCDTVTKLHAWLTRHGSMPLPPYIKRPVHASDSHRYRTIYAAEKWSGSAAAPTAGLHFSQQLLAQLRQKDIQFVFVRLHISGGTFLPVRTEELTHHVMHAEKFMVSRAALKTIYHHIHSGSKIVMVGTTALRAVESLGQMGGYNFAQAMQYVDQWHSTELFISPAFSHDTYRPWLAHGMITNFHAPKSTLLMLVSALVSYSNACKLYDHALKSNYRFLSYGDASLLWWG